MLVRLGVVESEEVIVLEQERGRAGRKADLVHWHAAFEIVGNAVNEARVACNDVSSFDSSTSEEQTEPSLREGGRAPFETELPMFVHQVVEEGRGGG